MRIPVITRSVFTIAWIHTLESVPVLSQNRDKTKKSYIHPRTEYSPFSFRATEGAHAQFYATKSAAE